MLDQTFVTLQEANAIGALDLRSGAFSRVIGLGVKDFSLPGNQIDPLNNGTIEFISPAVKGLYMPDTVASTLGAVPPLATLRVSKAESSTGNLFTAGARSFSIRDTDGNLVYDSGDILDKEAASRGIYNDSRRPHLCVHRARAHAQCRRRGVRHHQLLRSLVH